MAEHGERSDDELIRDLHEDLRKTTETPLKDDSALDLEPLADKPPEPSSHDETPGR